jgi:hypothetical protein
MARIDAFIGSVLGNIDQTKCWIGEDTSNAVGDGRLAMPRLTQKPSPASANEGRPSAP